MTHFDQFLYSVREQMNLFLEGMDEQALKAAAELIW